MPRLSAWFVRFSLAYLAIGFSAGSLMLANEGLRFIPGLEQILPAHIEMLMLGWVMQLAMGVAYWILPRHARGLPRGNEALAWLALALLNAGILLVMFNVIFQFNWLPFLGRFLEVTGILIFVLLMWRRVRPSFQN